MGIPGTAISEDLVGRAAGSFRRCKLLGHIEGRWTTLPYGTHKRFDVYPSEEGAKRTDASWDIGCRVKGSHFVLSPSAILWITNHRATKVVREYSGASRRL